MRIAFCTTCKGRVQHIRQTLPKNLADNADYEDCVFILLNYNSPDNLMEAVQPITDPRLFVYTYPNPGLFRMTHSKNMAHRLGIEHEADILVNMDADNFTGKGFASYINDTYKLYGMNTLMWARMVQGCHEWFDNGRQFCILPRGHDLPHSNSQTTLELIYAENDRPLVRGVSGRIVVPKDAFLKSGGYDEAKYDNWGPDDRDFNWRVQRLGYTPREIAGRYLKAIPHSEKVRFKEYPHVKNLDYYAWRKLEETAAAEVHTAVVNYGKEGTGLATERYGKVIDLKPIPTRIFGIGWHKTATASLADALRILGYETWHWENPKMARTIWEELREYGKSLTLEKYEAATDSPLNILYKELDQAYPNSKYILTIRDDNAWLESARKHWDPDINPYVKKSEWNWDVDAFTHRLHNEMYGRKKFDEHIMLERYKQHNREVIEYFKDRPEDLLIMTEMEWPKLCTFLNAPVPSISYPKTNQMNIA